jgi:nicotinamide riboside kinase
LRKANRTTYLAGRDQYVSWSAGAGGRYYPKANKLLICDTTFITVKIWSDEIFGKAPQEVIDELPKHPYDLYLLLDIDLPWQDDPLRDFPHLREHFLDVWHKELQALNANYVTISGTGDEQISKRCKCDRCVSV